MRLHANESLSLLCILFRLYGGACMLPWRSYTTVVELSALRDQLAPGDDAFARLLNSTMARNQARMLAHLAGFALPQHARVQRASLHYSLWYAEDERDG